MKIIYNYITTNILNNKKYIGMHCSNNVDDSYLGSGVALKKAFIKYGRENFKREVLCVCDTIEEAFKNEEILIKKYNTLDPFGYNLSPTGGLLVPNCFSDEMKMKISIRRRGQKASEETKQKMRNRKCSDELRERYRIAATGRKHSDEFKKKLSERSKGVVFTEERKRKISESKLGKPPWNKGKKNIYSEETKTKMSLSRKGKNTWIKGRHHSEETKEKIRQKQLGHKMPLHLLLAQTGRKSSVETRQKISKSLIGNKRALKKSE